MQDRATWREQVRRADHTGNPFDLALTSDGYFTVTTPNGRRLTRNGRRFGPMPSTGNAVLDTGNSSRSACRPATPP